MSMLTEWFEGRSVEEEHEIAYWRRVITEVACVVCAGLILAGLPAAPRRRRGLAQRSAPFNFSAKTQVVCRW